MKKTVSERALVGSLLLDTVNLPRVRETIEQEVFTDRNLRAVYEAICDLADDGQPVDFNTVSERLANKKRLADLGGRQGVVALVENSSTSQFDLHHAQALAEAHEKRRLSKKLKRAARDLEESCAPRAASEIAQKLKEELSALGTWDTSPLSVTTFTDIEEQEVRWLWEGYIAFDNLTIFGGDPGRGKSLVSTWCAAVVSAGLAWPDGSLAEQGNVLILAAEDAPDTTIKPRLASCGAAMNRVHFIEGVTRERERLISFVKDIEKVKRTCEQYTNLKLLVVDPASAYLGDKVDSNQDASVRSLVLAPLAKMARELGIAVVLVMHKNKDQKRDLLYRLGGSIGFTGAARSVVGFESDPADSADGGAVLFGRIKGNLGPPPPVLAYKIHATGRGQRIRPEWENEPREGCLREILGAAENLRPRDKAEVFLLKELADGPRPTAEIKIAAEEAGISWRTVERARKELKLDSWRDGRQFVVGLPGSEAKAAKPLSLGGGLADMPESGRGGGAKPDSEAPTPQRRQTGGEGKGAAEYAPAEPGESHNGEFDAEGGLWI